ncbi:ABC transporter ATP-binding protein [Prochlorococcus marinus XMU1406]|uniref:ABC transporter ATP-binding protein n=1 Tax=Prochlorococcus marinus TaxID=1219 RepID=UPI001AD9F212|nr:ABC transporter ATP-binding protein [Prochlorococcus marinus XMU1406]MCR8542652.1 ABC transporter ATP-binding protein/permease [Prochlorococcus marinus XMU1427]
MSSISPLLKDLSSSNALNTQSSLEIYLANNILINFDSITIKLFIFVSAVILAGVTRLHNLWIMTRVSAQICHEIAMNLYKKNIFQSYENHIKKSSDYLINVCTREMERVRESIDGIFNITTSITISASLLFTIYKINGSIIWIIMFIFLIIYLVYYFFSIRFTNKYGKIITRSGTKQINILQETSFGFLDIILYGLKNKYIDKYNNNEKLLRETYGNINFIGLSPKFIVEPIVIVSCLLISFIFAKKLDSGYENFLPSLGVFAIGGQKLLPSINQFFASYAAIQANNSAFNSVIANYKKISQPKNISVSSKNQFEFNKNIQIKNLSYFYGNHNEITIIDDITFEINKGEKIGIVGNTGCGKSTLIKIMMGILNPSGGEIYIDNKLLFPYDKSEIDIEEWYRKIAHVPQDIFLMDASIMENITFKNDLRIEDLKKLRKIIKVVNLENFINELNDGIYTKVGERGIRLSGGQKQRIGIARALFKTKSIIFLDEATSALDTKTEKKIIKNIEENYPDLTILSIAHRLTTLNNYDQIFELRSGKIEKFNLRKNLD